MKLCFDPADLSNELSLSQEDGQCTRRLGAIFISAARTMARGPQYRDYAYRQELEGTAIVDLVSAVSSWRPGRDPNPWIATICRRAFWRVIKREKKALATSLRLAADVGGELTPAQIAWLAEQEAAGK